MTRTGAVRLTILALILVVVAGAAGFLLWPRTQGLVFYVSFREPNALARNSQVVFYGMPIGRVLEATADSATGGRVLKVSIDREHRDLVRAGNVFWVSQQLTAQGKVEAVLNTDMTQPGAAVIRAGDLIQAADSELQAQYEKARGQGESAVQANLRLEELRITTVVTADGAVERTFAMEVGKLIPSQVVLDTLLPSGAGWTPETAPLADGQLVTVRGRFDRPQAAAWRNSQLAVRRETGLFTEDIIFDETLDKEALAIRLASAGEEREGFSIGQLLALGAKVLKGELTIGQALGEAAPAVLDAVLGEVNRLGSIPAERISLAVTVRLPGTVIETNAPVSRGGYATWSLRGEELRTGVLLHVVSRRPLWLRIIAVGVVLLAAAGVVVARVLRQRSMRYVPPQTEEEPL